jgi:hypothetical protein
MITIPRLLMNRGIFFLIEPANKQTNLLDLVRGVIGAQADSVRWSEERPASPDLNGKMPECDGQPQPGHFQPNPQAFAPRIGRAQPIAVLRDGIQVPFETGTVPGSGQLAAQDIQAVTIAPA